MSKRLKWVGLIALLAFLSPVLGAAGGKGETAKAEDTILIGAALCLTGIQAPLDEPAVRGAQLAVEEINKNGGVLGKKLEFVNLDGKSDPVTVGNVAVQLIEQGAKAIIAPSDFDFGGPASREAQKAGLVGISPCASSPLYGSRTLGDKQFTMSMWNTTMGAATAEYAYNQKGWRIGYVVTDAFIDYTKSLSRYFIQHFRRAGRQDPVRGDLHPGRPGLLGPAGPAESLAREAGFHVHLLLHARPGAPSSAPSARRGSPCPSSAATPTTTPACSQALGEQYGNDIFFDTHTFLSAGISPKMDEFLDAYKAKFNDEPEAVWVAPGWDVVHVLAQAMEKAGSTDGAAMAKAMEETEFDLSPASCDWSGTARGTSPTRRPPLVQLTRAVPAFLGWMRPTNIPEP